MAPAFPLTDSLSQRKVSSKVVDVDHHKTMGGLSVETDYIIQVKVTESQYETVEYLISKTFSQFRHLSNKFKTAAEVATAGLKSQGKLTKTASYVVRLSDAFSKIIDTEPVEYLSKVSYNYVKKMAKERTNRINDALIFLVSNFPPTEEERKAGGVREVAMAIENFFLTDHVVEEGVDVPEMRGSKMVTTTTSKTTTVQQSVDSKLAAGKARTAPTATASDNGPAVVPISKKTRKSMVVRAQHEQELREGGLVIEEEDGKSSPKGGAAPTSALKKSKFKSTQPSPAGKRSAGGRKKKKKEAEQALLDSTIVKAAIVLFAAYVLRRAGRATIKMDGDYAMLLSFAFFCLGMHVSPPSSRRSVGGDEEGAVPPSPAPSQRGIAREKAVKSKKRGVTIADSAKTEEAGGFSDRNKSLALLRKSISTASINLGALRKKAHEVDDSDEETEDEFDEEELDDRPVIMSPLPTFPEGGDPHVDLNCTSEPDHTKFNVRGGDYLTDKKKVPSEAFLFPFRGVDLFLTDECPENVGRNSAVMGGKLRDVPTFLVNFRLPWGVLVFYFEIPSRFVPFLKKGHEPGWSGELPPLDAMPPAERCTARYLMGDEEHKKQTFKLLPMVVIGPWIVKGCVGSKPAIIGNKLPVEYVYQAAEPGKAEYLEADLDIVSSAAARKILAVCRGATQGLTIDLGFLCEGKLQDELPEQMMVGARLHGLDPLNASLLPPMPLDVLDADQSSDDE